MKMKIMKLKIGSRDPLALTKSCSLLFALFTATTATAEMSLHLEKTADKVVVTWPSTLDPWVRVDFSPIHQGGWKACPEEVADDGVTRKMTLAPNGSAQFFRLFDPLAAITVGRGGGLYDAFWTTTGVVAPTNNHPLWASRPDLISDKSKGSTTWRCKECHGFDYQGVNGQYATGTHRTGIRGIFGTTKTDAELADLIKNNHSYGTVISDAEIDNLVQFIRQGQVNTTRYIDTNGVAKGDVVRGKALYLMGIGVNPGCAACHATDGLGKPPDFPTFADFPGFKSHKDVWEFQHKVRFGAKGKTPTPMAGTLSGGDSFQDVADVVAYCQTLPQTITATVARGGALYDKWWEVTIGSGSAGPTNNHPLWASRPDLTSNTRSGSATWRCTECHGFDYRGVAGAYATGNHRTGIRGINGTTKSASELTELLTNHHSYGTVLSAVEIQSLVLFVLQGQIDTTAILNGTVFQGNVARGHALYDSGIGSNLSCTACHGAAGLAIPPGYSTFIDYPGLKSTTNPWENQHKLRFGHPGSAMPGSVDSGGTLQDMVDVAAYCQTLPVAPPPPVP